MRRLEFCLFLAVRAGSTPQSPHRHLLSQLLALGATENTRNRGGRRAEQGWVGGRRLREGLWGVWKRRGPKELRCTGRVTTALVSGCFSACVFSFSDLALWWLSQAGALHARIPFPLCFPIKVGTRQGVQDSEGRGRSGFVPDAVKVSGRPGVPTPTA